MPSPSSRDHELIVLDDSFILAADRIDLSKEGAHLVGEDSTDVSYYAEVKGGKIVGYFCEDSSGVRIPSFVIQNAHIRPVDRNGVKTHLKIGGAVPLDDGGTCLCCHRVGKGTVTCHAIKCP